MEELVQSQAMYFASLTGGIAFALSGFLAGTKKNLDWMGLFILSFLSLFSFRYAPEAATGLDALNLALVEAINADGCIYLTQTRVDGRVAIRFQVGQFECTEADVMSAYGVITEIAHSL